jgi:hypothetical protein
MFADLTVLSGPLLHAQVDYTIVGGKIAYQRR